MGKKLVSITNQSMKEDPEGHLIAHKIFVPTHFIQELMSPLVPNVETKVGLFPHGFDEDVFRYKSRHHRVNSDTFQFVWISVWGGRKNTKAALEAFVLAFPDGTIKLADGRTTRVELKLVCGQPPTIKPWEREYWSAKPGIIIVDPDESRTDVELAQHYHDADCLVFPTYAEGFGLTVLEAMATGLPVIVPDFSGIQDFCDRQSCVMIPPTRWVNMTLGSIPGCGADIDPRVLAAVMKMMVLDRQGSILLGKRAAEKAHRDWTWRKVVRDFDQKHICPLFESL
ncbi:uncharacterized protein BJ171DRAFT_489724 [Polychytrium aggregatum]|uniref:uncharacterized protein n=1 Tax=Polychytrium aggregatum TaxID=110093 RepID=UPI0022FE9030|nr:uncharacterized protein BJ171DRAFT_489724 [Polychytrium aggregatum]KAI9208705.1 hypothetical protein BJ171DRAFT_489724 [Polychytrium aggregatum]